MSPAPGRATDRGFADLLEQARVEAILERVDVHTPTPDWARSAPCRGLPVDVFYGYGEAHAKQICDTCHLRAPCLIDAIRTERHAINKADIFGRRVISASARSRFILTHPGEPQCDPATSPSPQPSGSSPPASSAPAQHPHTVQPSRRRVKGSPSPQPRTTAHPPTTRSS